jgi:hypothetical protein
MIGVNMKVGHFVFHRGRWTQPIDKTFNSEKTLVVVFADDLEALSHLQSELPLCHFIGCSTSGAIDRGEVIHRSLVATAIYLEQTRFKISGPYKISDTVNEKLALRVISDLAHPDLSGVLSFICMNGHEIDFVSGIRKGLNKNVPFIGGTAAHPDHTTYEGTYVVDGRGIHERSVIAVGFYGPDFSIHSHAESGHQPIGQYGIVTESVGNKVFKVDDKSVISYYAQNLGFPKKDFFLSILQYPLEVIAPGDGVGQIISPIHISEQEDAMLFSRAIPVGTRVRISVGKKNDLLQGSRKASEVLWQEIAEKKYQAGVLLSISCGARRLILGDEVEDEHDAVDRRLVQSATSWSGAHLYGEITHDKDAGTHYQNETINLIYLNEKKSS